MSDRGPIERLRANPAISAVRDSGRLPDPPAGSLRAEISGAAIADRDALFDALTVALDLPEWFGRNWDALNDCLGDLSWIDAEHIVLVLTDAEEMLRSAPRTSAYLLDIWSGAVVAQAARGRSLQLYLVLGR